MKPTEIILSFIGAACICVVAASSDAKTQILGASIAITCFIFAAAHMVVGDIKDQVQKLISLRPPPQNTKPLEEK